MPEERKQKLTKEQRAQIRREKEKAFFRSQNELIEHAEAQSLELVGEDDEHYDEIMDAFNEAKNDNRELIKARHGFTQDEVDNAKYTEVKDRYKRMYEKHLKKIGKTDEEMRRRDLTNGTGQVVEATVSSETKKKKWFSFSKREEDNKTEYNNSTMETKEEQDQKNIGILGALLGKQKKEREQQNAVDMDKQVDVPLAQNKEKLEPVKEEPKVVNVTPNTPIEDYKFDPTDLSPMTRYDFIELPSKGKCYKHKKNTIPVRELTASDENLIASPNMYLNGQLIDTLLRRCILDKSFNVDEMCPGDRDAVVLYLRATAFGAEYDVTAKNPDNGKMYTASVNLAKLDYKPFDLEEDEDGHFPYMFENGDVAKFKILSFKETQDLQNNIALKYVNQKKFDVYKKIQEIKNNVNEIFKQELEDEPLNDAIGYISDWCSKDVEDVEEDTLYTNFVTENLIQRTYSINGSTDREYIENYINGLPIKESKKYREYLFNNLPGLDFSVEIPIPESDGGGSFTSFLKYDDTIFFE